MLFGTLSAFRFPFPFPFLHPSDMSSSSSPSRVIATRSLSSKSSVLDIISWMIECEINLVGIEFDISDGHVNINIPSGTSRIEDPQDLLRLILLLAKRLIPSCGIGKPFVLDTPTAYLSYDRPTAYKASLTFVTKGSENAE